MHVQKRGHQGGDAAFMGGGGGGSGPYMEGAGGYGHEHEMQNPYGGGGSMSAYPAAGNQDYAYNADGGGEMKSLF